MADKARNKEHTVESGSVRQFVESVVRVFAVLSALCSFAIGLGIRFIKLFFSLFAGLIDHNKVSDKKNGCSK